MTLSPWTLFPSRTTRLQRRTRSVVSCDLIGASSQTFARFLRSTKKVREVRRNSLDRPYWSWRWAYASLSLLQQVRRYILTWEVTTYRYYLQVGYGTGGGYGGVMGLDVMGGYGMFGLFRLRRLGMLIRTPHPSALRSARFLGADCLPPYGILVGSTCKGIWHPNGILMASQSQGHPPNPKGIQGVCGWYPRVGTSVSRYIGIYVSMYLGI